jgi:hypothetical protein
VLLAKQNKWSILGDGDDEEVELNKRAWADDDDEWGTHREFSFLRQIRFIEKWNDEEDEK